MSAYPEAWFSALGKPLGAGAAIYALHRYRLARVASVPPDHPFMRKYALFCGGRWPLGVYGDRFAIF